MVLPCLRISSLLLLILLTLQIKEKPSHECGLVLVEFEHCVVSIQLLCSATKSVPDCINLFGSEDAVCLQRPFVLAGNACQQMDPDSEVDCMHWVQARL